MSNPLPPRSNRKRRIPGTRLRAARVVGLVAPVALLVSACATTLRPVAPQPTVTLNCQKPVLAPLAETAELQEKGGIQMSVTPLGYECKQDVKVMRSEAVPSFGEHLQGALMVGNEGIATRFVEERRTPVVKVAPDRLAFHVKLHNKLPRVFRGAGIVVHYVVAGKGHTVDQKLYGNLINAIVPPRAQQEVTILGPPISEIPAGSTIGIFFYDVITAVDAAGNVEEKHNFEWYFNFETQLETSTAPVQVTRAWERT